MWSRRSFIIPAMAFGLTFCAAMAQDSDDNTAYLAEVGVAAASLTSNITEEQADDCLMAYDFTVEARPDTFGELRPFIEAFWGAFHVRPGQEASDDELFATDWQKWIASGFTPEGEEPVKGAPSSRKIAKSVRKKNDACFNDFYPYFDEAMSIVDARYASGEE